MGARTLQLLRRWALRPDPEDVGMRQAWWENPPKEGWVSCRADEPWQNTLGEAFHGVGWYRRRVRLPRKWLGRTQRVWLRCDAVATDHRVWVNGIEIGAHTGDFVPFEFDITDALGESERCEIVCRVDEIEGSPSDTPGEQPWGGHITKGFHDVLGIQHGGLWGGVGVRVTGPSAIRPNGLSAVADARTGEVRVRIELHTSPAQGLAEVILVEPGTGCQHRRRATIPADAGSVELSFVCEHIHRWSPDDPILGSIHATVRAKGDAARDEATVRFAFRTVEIGGRENRRILFNGKPMLIRGVLDWCVEPGHIAPAPTREELVERFSELRARGFNCVCVCMVYPPEYYYDIADEMGMLIWQVHPVWKSAMTRALMPEYRRLYNEFFRRDRHHPSVILVSATCEHERFDAELGRWWWERGRKELPGTLLQVQTGFLAWSDAARTDLWDEHTYDNAGRWVRYFDDLEAFLSGRPAKPVVMGETIIGTHWPDTAALLEKLGDERPWWAPRGLDAFAEFERVLVDRFGDSALDRLRTHGDAFSLGQRKFQSEVFRAYAHNAGWVMNHIRDVSCCQCGFQDDLNRWRFCVEQFKPFLGDRAFLLRTPGYAVGLKGDGPVHAELGMSNFGTRTFEGVVRIRWQAENEAGEIELPITEVDLRVEPGEVEFARIDLLLPATTDPTMVRCRAEADEVVPNEWRLWVFPKTHDLPEGIFREVVLPWTDDELEPDFEEKRYSSGWALACSSWKPGLPDLAELLPATPMWPNDEQQGGSKHRTIVTTRLTAHSMQHLEHGGRVVLLASRAAGSPPTGWVNLYGQVPMIAEAGSGGHNTMLRAKESAWVLATLGLDLNRRSCCAVPTQALGLAETVEPIIRLVMTHDRAAPECWDQVFTARVGAGLLAVSTLDHANPAGMYFLSRLLRFVAQPETLVESTGRLTMECVQGWCASEVLRDRFSR